MRRGAFCLRRLTSPAIGDQIVDHGRIGQRRGIAERAEFVLGDLAQDATPDVIQFAPGLPKTRSGKIMRRILRKIAENEFGALGDTSTLADPTVVDDLIANRG